MGVLLHQGGRIHDGFVGYANVILRMSLLMTDNYLTLPALIQMVHCLRVAGCGLRRNISPNSKELRRG
jgi:hypothetical protein